MGVNYDVTYFINYDKASVIVVRVDATQYEGWFWHGTLDDLRDNLNDLVRRYNKDVIVVEYSALKKEVNKIAFELPNGKGKETCIWEPLNTWEKVFDNDGKSNAYLAVYDELTEKFILNK